MATVQKHNDDEGKSKATVTLLINEEKETESNKETLETVETPKLSAAALTTTTATITPPTTATTITTNEHENTGMVMAASPPTTETTATTAITETKKTSEATKEEENNGTLQEKERDHKSTSSTLAVSPLKKYVKFEERIAALSAYKSKYGTYDVDKSIDPNLAMWVQTTRRGKHYFKEDKLQMLRDIGFYVTPEMEKEAVLLSSKLINANNPPSSSSTAAASSASDTTNADANTSSSPTEEVEKTTFVVGTKVSKNFFGAGWFRGKISSYSEVDCCYWVQYDQGGKERFRVPDQLSDLSEIVDNADPKKRALKSKLQESKKVQGKSKSIGKTVKTWPLGEIEKENDNEDMKANNNSSCDDTQVTKEEKEGCGSGGGKKRTVLSKRKRGRPKKKISSETVVVSKATVTELVKPKTSPPKKNETVVVFNSTETGHSKRKRGRPKKNETVVAFDSTVTGHSKRKRGRPKKNSSETAVVVSDSSADLDGDIATGRPTKRPRIDDEKKANDDIKDCKEEGPTTTKKVSEKMMFMNEKKKILSEVPKEVKKQFREVGFGMWRGMALPVMFVGPYDVPPRSEARNLWMKMFQKLNKKKDKIPIEESMFPRLVYWYGECSFSLLPREKTMSYEMGCKEGYNTLPSTIQEKVYSDANDNGPMTLSSMETQLVDGLQEINKDHKLPAKDRQPWLFEFEEEYEQQENGSKRSKRKKHKDSDDEQHQQERYEVVVEKMKQVMQWAMEENTPQFDGRSNDWCCICDDGGDLLVCEFCPNVAHQKCIMIDQGEKNDELDYFICGECIRKWNKKRKTQEEKGDKNDNKNNNYSADDDGGGDDDDLSGKEAASSDNATSSNEEVKPMAEITTKVDDHLLGKDATSSDNATSSNEEVKPMAEIITKVEIYVFGREVGGDSDCLLGRLRKIEMTLFGKEYDDEAWSSRCKRLEPYGK